MTEPYQDADPISTNRTSNKPRKASTTSESKNRFRNPFARSQSNSKTTPSAISSSSYPNPFATPDAADDITLANHDPAPYDPDAEFHDVADRWTFKLKQRNASAPASDVGEHPHATSLAERSTFAELMHQTRDMTPDQVRDFLKAKDKVDGEKIRTAARAVDI